jgi:hypothetical protein
MPVQGICKLCGNSGDLVESHLELPKFVYKRLRTEAAKNPNPVQISSGGGLKQTAAQQRLSLLCSDCDGGRFGKLGERWVAGACLQADSSFPLRDLVLSAPFETDGISTAFFRTAKVPGLNHTALEYFAASMIWRAQFLPRNPISLGPYDPQFRDYLLGVGAFPKDATLVVAIRHRSNLTQVSHFVQEAAVEDRQSFSFYIPGLFFSLILESLPAPSLQRLACFVHAPDRIILDSDVVDQGLHERITQVTLAAKTAGKRWRITDDSKPHHFLKNTPSSVKRETS